MLTHNWSQKSVAHHRLHVDHAVEAFGLLVQKAVPSLLSRFSALSFNVEVERFRSLKSNLAKGAAEEECNMNGL